MNSFLRLTILLVFTLPCSKVSAREYEIPVKKAIPPEMDPIPYVNIAVAHLHNVFSKDSHSLRSYRVLPEITHRVYLDLSVGRHKDRVILGLFGRVAPRTVENFRALATCARTGLCYKGSKIHRIIPHFGLQGGDFTHGDGTGGKSIYGGRFEDEYLELNFHRPYLLAMSNAGKKNTNGSQFFINSVKTQWLSGKNVIFGMVLEGQNVLKDLEENYGTYSGTPTQEVTIVDCGEMPLEPQDKEVHYA